MRSIHLFMSGKRGQILAEGLVKAGCNLKTIYLPDDAELKEDILESLGQLDCKIIRVKNPNNKKFISGCKILSSDLVIVAGYPVIFKEPFLNLVPGRIINLHAGPVPKYRGGSPLNWQLIMGEKTGRISIITMVEEIDQGNILAQASFPILPTDTIVDLHKKANNLFPKLTLDVLQKQENGAFEGEVQTQLGAKYWPQRNFEDGQIDWAGSTASEIDRFIRALVSPYPGAFSRLNGNIVRFDAAKIPEMVITGQPGRVCYVSGMGPFVICKDRAILIEKYEILRADNIHMKAETSKIPNGVYFRLESLT